MVIEREVALLTPFVRGSAKLLEDLLDDDFTEIGASGRTWARSEIIVALVEGAEANQPRIDYREMKGRVVAPGLVLLTYLSTVDERRARRSSLWRRSSQGWRVLHHQGTSVP